MKKVFALILALICLLSVAACSDGAGDPADSTAAPVTEEETNQYTLDIPEIDMTGKTFRIFTGEYSTDKINTFSVEEDDGDPLNSALFYRNLALTERFGCTFEEILANDVNSASEYSTIVGAGSDDFDVAIIRDRVALSLSIDELVYSFNKLPHINLENPWWYKNVADYLSINNKVFFSFGYHNIDSFDSMNIMVFNKKNIEDYKMDDPYSLIRNGEWTIDKLYSMMKLYAGDDDGDNNLTDTDRWGAVFFVNQWYNSFGAVSGYSSVAKDDEDRPILNVEQPLLDIWQKLVSYTSDGTLFNMSVKTADTYNKNFAYQNCVDMFSAGNVLFIGTYVNYMARFRAMEDEYGIIPYPKNIEVAPGSVYSGYTSGGLPMIVPITCTDTETVSAVIEAMAYETFISVIPKYYDTVVLVKNTRDDDSAQMLQMMNENRVMDMGETYWYEQVFTIMHKQFNDEDPNFKSAFDARIKPIENAFDRAFECFQNID